MTLTALAIFAGALALNSGTPGPSVAALVSRVITNGWRDIVPFIAAMWVGEVLWLTLAMAGLSTLAQTFQAGFQVLRWLGVAYLCWLAWKMWRQPAAINGAELPRRASPLSMFGAGMALTLGNPKIMMFYLALLPALVDLPSATVADWAVLAVITLVTVAAVDCAWMALAHRARRLLQTPRAARIANRVSATALGGAAAVIASRH